MRSLNDISDNLEVLGLELLVLRQRLDAVQPSEHISSELPQASVEARPRLIVVGPSSPSQPLSEADQAQKPDSHAQPEHPSGQMPVITSALPSSMYLPYNHSRALICTCKALFKTVKIGLALCLAWIFLFGQPIKLWEALIIILKAILGLPQ